MAKEISVVSIGHIAVDIHITRDRETQFRLGGGGLLPAVAAEKVLPGERIGVVARRGRDFFGKQADAYMKGHAIDTEGVTVAQDGNTTAVAIIEETSNKRRILVDPGVSEQVVYRIPKSYKNAPFIHLGSGPPEQQQQWLGYLRTHTDPSRTTISGDPLDVFVARNPLIAKSVLEGVDLVFINGEELRQLTKFGGVVTDKPVVLKEGAKGAWYLDGETRLHVPAPKKKVVHTGGAGEVVAGVFLGLRAQNVPIEQALEKAVQLASESVTDFGIEHIPKQGVIFEQEQAS